MLFTLKPVELEKPWFCLKLLIFKSFITNSPDISLGIRHGL